MPSSLFLIREKYKIPAYRGVIVLLPSGEEGVIVGAYGLTLKIDVLGIVKFLDPEAVKYNP